MRLEELVERLTMLSLSLAQALDEDRIDEAGALLDAREQVIAHLESADTVLPENLAVRIRQAETRAAEAADRARARIAEAFRYEERLKTGSKAYVAAASCR